jgi:bacterioferritin-associated ferredoxin
MTLNNKKNLICYCNNITYEEISKILYENQNIDFETFQKKSNAGTACSACIPNLENEFIKLSNRKVSTNFLGEVKKNKSFKEYVYDLIDKLSPNYSITLSNYFPIIYKEDIQIKIWISNFSNLYLNKDKIVEYKIKIKLFNSVGKKVWSQKFNLENNKNLIIDIPNNLINYNYNDKNNLSLGWLLLEKRSKSSGYRGTTRPQIQIISKKSSCAVHGQNIHSNNGGSHAYVYNPDAERQFLSFFNISNKDINLQLFYFDKNDKINLLKNFQLKSKHSKIIELSFLNKEFMKFDPINIIWKGSGLYKTHVFISDKKIERVSIDHL